MGTMVLRRPRKASKPPAAPPTMAQVSEAGFHAWLTRTLPAGRSGLLPIGDDCAAIPADGHTVHLLTTDSVLEGTHFPPTADPRMVGRFAANVNFSDLAAKGGVPIALLGALLLPASTPIRWAEGVVQGMEEASQAAGCHLVGGDSKKSDRRGIVPVAVGTADDRALMPISGARPGDLLATTGTVGRGSAAYVAWKEEALSEKDALGVLLGVRPRLAEGRALSRTAHATTDTSDGLLAAIRHLMAASSVSVRLRAAWVPYDPLAVKVAKALDHPIEEVAFQGGDYQLLTAIPKGSFDATLKNMVRAQGQLKVIGTVAEAEEPSVVEQDDGQELPLPEGGWDSFTSP